MSTAGRVNVRENQRVLKKALYLVLAVNLDGQKELLDMWLAQTEGAKFWLSVLTEVQNRGVKVIYTTNAIESVNDEQPLVPQCCPNSSSLVN